jgi:hypothetical protein
VKGRVVPAPATFHVVVTCEHAAAAIPRKFGDLGLPAAVRASHRAYDAGALGIAKAIAKALQAPLHVGAWSRLVVDLNRSHDQPAVIPRRVDGRPIAGNQVDGLARKQRVLEYWMPYRMAATADIAAASHRGVVLHLSVHSFTPTLRGVVRRNDIGLRSATSSGRPSSRPASSSGATSPTSATRMASPATCGSACPPAAISGSRSSATSAWSARRRGPDVPRGRWSTRCGVWCRPSRGERLSSCRPLRHSKAARSPVASAAADVPPRHLSHRCHRGGRRRSLAGVGAALDL